MMLRNAITALATLGLLIGGAAAANRQRQTSARKPSGESEYVRSKFTGTEISPQTCKLVNAGSEKQLRDCGGIAGYHLLYSGAVEKPEIIITTPNGSRFPIIYWDVASGNFISLSKSVEWRFLPSSSGKTPLALIFNVDVKPPEFSRVPEGPYEVIVKLNPREVCTVGRIPPGPEAAADFAGFIITARYRKCIRPDDVGREDWVGVVFGLVDAGKLAEAKATIKKIRSPGGRATAYVNIATGEAAAGDIPAARKTLLEGLADAQKKQASYIDEYGDTVNEGDVYRIIILQLITGMTQIGLYDDARATIKFLETADDVFLAQVSIAKIQGKSYPNDKVVKVDREASRRSFKEALEFALRPVNSQNRDSWLYQLVDAQLDTDWIEDAKVTASHIQAPSARAAAEYSIRQHSQPN